MKGRIIPGWKQSEGYKTMQCPTCKQYLSTKGTSLKCKKCNRIYYLDPSNMEKVVDDNDTKNI